MKQDRQLVLAHELLKPINISVTIVVHIYVFLWGLWLTLPVIDTFGTSPMYHLFDNLAPEWLYGILAMIIAIGSIYGIVSKSFNYLKWSNLTAFVYYMIISALLLAGDWRAPAFITTLLISGYCGFIYVNLNKNQEHYLSEYHPRYHL